MSRAGTSWSWCILVWRRTLFKKLSLVRYFRSGHKGPCLNSCPPIALPVLHSTSLRTKPLSSMCLSSSLKVDCGRASLMTCISWASGLTTPFRFCLLWRYRDASSLTRPSHSATCDFITTVQKVFAWLFSLYRVIRQVDIAYYIGRKRAAWSLC